MIKLREYQSKIIENIRKVFKIGHNRVVMMSPTGSGKTVMFSFIVKAASEKGLKCLILTDRVELLSQTGGTFDKVGIQYENITAQTKAIPNGLVMIGMIETIKRRCKSRLDFAMLLKRVDLVIADECHKRTHDPMFQYFKDECYVIGATATPIRQGKKSPLCDFYTTIVEGPSIESLISQGYLSKPSYFGVSVDLSKLKMKAGEFDEKDMERLYSETKVFSGLKENLAKHASGLKTMIFCPSVNSSIQVARDLGCLHIDGSMGKVERAATLSEFESTNGSVITNVGITTTGYDHPGIECIVLYRATTSLPLYLQMLGRASRVAPGKNTFKILDFGMNVQRFGYWHIERKWSLEPATKKSRNKLDAFPVKFCPQCGGIVAAQAKTCSECGYEWPVTEKERVFAELQEMDYSSVEKRMSGASVAEMEEIRVARGYKVGYILHRFTERGQFDEYARLREYKNGWARIQAERYKIEN
jgi:superfamily II DNA or RNA helicase